MYIGMPYNRDKGEIPAIGLFIEKPFQYSSDGIQFEVFMWRRKDPPEMEHCHRLVFSFGFYLIRSLWVGYRRRRYKFFINLFTVPAWWDEPTARAHYLDRGQKWRT